MPLENMEIPKFQYKILFVNNFQNLIKFESADWTLKSLLPALNSPLAHKESYTYRNNGLYGLEHVIRSFSGSVRGQALAQLLAATEDTVPNVRMVVGIVCNRVFDVLEQNEKNQVLKYFLDLTLFEGLWSR